MHVTCDTAVIGHAVVKNLLFFTSSTAVCGCFRVSQLHCTIPRSDVTSNEACTLFLHHIYVPAGFCAAGTCGRDNMPDHCDRTQAKQVWSLYDIVAPLQETLNFVAGSSRSLSLLARYCSAHRGPMLTDRSAAGDCALQPGRRVLQAQARTISRQQKAVCGKNKRNGQRCNYSQKDWCYTSVCKPGKCCSLQLMTWNYGMGLRLKALLCCLRLRSGCESGLTSMNPMLDFAAASSETKALDKGNSEMLHTIRKFEHSHCELWHSMDPQQLRNADRCAHQPCEPSTRRYLCNIVLQNRKLCLPSIHTSVDIIKSNQKELQPHKPKLVLQTQLTLKASHYQARKQSCNASCVSCTCSICLRKLVCTELTQPKHHNMK